MSKRLFILILCLSLVIGSSVPVFAVSTDSAIKLKSVASFSDVKASGDTVAPVSSSTTRWFLNSNGAIGTVSTTISTWGQLVYDITYSIAYSADQLDNRLSGILNLFPSNWFSNMLTATGLIRDYSSSIYSRVSNIASSVSNIESVITSGGGIQVDLEHWADLFYPDDSHWDRPTADQWNYFYTTYVGYNGSLTSETFRSSNIFYQFKRYLVNSNNSLGTIGMLLGNDTLYNSAADFPLTNNDLTTTTTAKKSIWWDIRAIGANLSEPLHRLAFVLASDEEIAARQAAAANTDQVVDDFINSSGSASASTSDFADVASAGSSMKDALSSNVSPSNAFTSLSSSSSAWDWFSQATADSLDSSSSSTRSRKGVSSTPYLDNYYSDLLETLMLR